MSCWFINVLLINNSALGENPVGNFCFAQEEVGAPQLAQKGPKKIPQKSCVDVGPV